MKKYIILTSLIACAILFVIEQYLQVSFIVKVLFKIPIFTLIPLIYIKLIKKKTIKNALNLNSFKLSELKLGLTLSAIIVVIIPLVYFGIAENYIDANQLIGELNSIGVNYKNFIFIAIYISIINSFLEEFFFRGYVFLNLYEDKKCFAYVFSSLLFAAYHIGIFISWFDMNILILALTALIVGGLIFNFLATKSCNFLNSWAVHFFADAVIMVIGFTIL